MESKLFYMYLTCENVKTNRRIVLRLYALIMLMYAFQSESTLYSCLNVKEHFARNMQDA